MIVKSQGTNLHDTKKKKKKVKRNICMLRKKGRQGQNSLSSPRFFQRTKNPRLPRTVHWTSTIPYRHTFGHSNVHPTPPEHTRPPHRHSPSSTADWPFPRGDCLRSTATSTSRWKPPENSTLTHNPPLPSPIRRRRWSAAVRWRLQSRGARRSVDRAAPWFHLHVKWWPYNSVRFRKWKLHCGWGTGGTAWRNAGKCAWLQWECRGGVVGWPSLFHWGGGLWFPCRSSDWSGRFPWNFGPKVRRSKRSRPALTVSMSWRMMAEANFWSISRLLIPPGFRPASRSRREVMWWSDLKNK